MKNLDVENAIVARKTSKVEMLGKWVGNSNYPSQILALCTKTCFKLTHFRIPSSSLHATKITILVSCAKWNSFMLFFALSWDISGLNPPFKVSKENSHSASISGLVFFSFFILFSLIHEDHLSLLPPSLPYLLFCFFFPPASFNNLKL